MKLKSQIVGLPVLSIVEVASLGKVEELVVNPDTGSVDFLILEPEQWYLEHRLISIHDVAGIGEDALTTETKTNVINISSVPNAIELVRKEIGVVGSQVITKKGRKNGGIDEIVIDEQTGKISGCRWIAADGVKTGIIPTEQVITYGKGMLVVEENFEATLLDNSSEIQVQAPPQPIFEQNQTTVDADPLQFFEDKQKQYLIGRTVTTDILSDEGEIIAEQGDKVTQDMVDKAVAADKFVELTLNTRE